MHTHSRVAAGSLVLLLLAVQSGAVVCPTGQHTADAVVTPGSATWASIRVDSLGLFTGNAVALSIADDTHAYYATSRSTSAVVKVDVMNAGVKGLGMAKVGDQIDIPGELSCIAIDFSHIYVSHMSKILKVSKEPFQMVDSVTVGDDMHDGGDIHTMVADDTHIYAVAKTVDFTSILKVDSSSMTQVQQYIPKLYPSGVSGSTTNDWTFTTHVTIVDSGTSLYVSIQSKDNENTVVLRLRKSILAEVERLTLLDPDGCIASAAVGDHRSIYYGIRPMTSGQPGKLIKITKAATDWNDAPSLDSWTKSTASFTGGYRFVGDGNCGGGKAAVTLLEPAGDNSRRDCKELCDETTDCTAFESTGCLLTEDCKGGCKLFKAIASTPVLINVGTSPGLGRMSYTVPLSEVAESYELVCSSITTNVIGKFMISVSEGNVYGNVGAGVRGGTCTCPDGQVFYVGDNNDSCGSLACDGGVSAGCTDGGIPVGAQRHGAVCAPPGHIFSASTDLPRTITVQRLDSPGGWSSNLQLNCQMLQKVQLVDSSGGNTKCYERQNAVGASVLLTPRSATVDATGETTKTKQKCQFYSRELNYFNRVWRGGAPAFLTENQDCNWEGHMRDMMVPISRPLFGWYQDHDSDEVATDMKIQVEFARAVDIKEIHIFLATPTDSAASHMPAYVHVHGYKKAASLEQSDDANTLVASKTFGAAVESFPRIVQADWADVDKIEIVLEGANKKYTALSSIRVYGQERFGMTLSQTTEFVSRTYPSKMVSIGDSLYIHTQNQRTDESLYVVSRTSKEGVESNALGFGNPVDLLAHKQHLLVANNAGILKVMGRERSACSNCPSGQFNAGAESSCSLCPAGYYSNSAADACVSCPAGRFGSSDGLQSSACTAECPAGRFRALPGTSTLTIIAIVLPDWPEGCGIPPRDATMSNLATKVKHDCDGRNNCDLTRMDEWVQKDCALATTYEVLYSCAGPTREPSPDEVTNLPADAQAGRQLQQGLQLLYPGRVCSEKNRTNLGEKASAMECASAAASHSSCHGSFMWTASSLTSDCWCCAEGDVGVAHQEWDVYSYPLPESCTFMHGGYSVPASCDQSTLTQANVLDTSISSGACAGGHCETDLALEEPWLQLDLGKERPVGKVKLHQLASTNADYEVWVGHEDETVAHEGGPVPFHRAHRCVAARSPSVVSTLEMECIATGRYILLRLPSSPSHAAQRLSVDEVEVFLTGTTTELVMTLLPEALPSSLTVKASFKVQGRWTADMTWFTGADSGTTQILRLDLFELPTDVRLTGSADAFTFQTLAFNSPFGSATVAVNNTSISDAVTTLSMSSGLSVRAVRRVTVDASLSPFELSCASTPVSIVLPSTVCTDCPAGKYGMVGGIASSACSGTCEAGKYSTGASGCVDCAAGRYGVAESETRSLCEASCPEGYFSFAGSTGCTACPPGLFGSSSGLVTADFDLEDSCERCPAGRYGSTGATLDSSCTGHCVPGQFSAAGSTTCTPCPAGRYGSIGAASNYLCSALCIQGRYSTAGQSICNQCAPGKYGETQGLAQESCTGDCKVGSYSRRGATGCEPCPLGTYGETTGLTTEACSGYCMPGKYGKETGYTTASMCIACPGGKWKETESYDQGANKCLECPPGTWGSGSESGRTNYGYCVQCPAGKFRNNGALSNDGRYCNKCPGGRYGYRNKMLYWQEGCILCERGRYGSLSRVDLTSCVDCASGFSSQSTRSSPSISGPICDTTCKIGTFTLGGVCKTCPVGRYSSDEGSGSCINCPEGRFGQTGGLSHSSCSGSCASGRYSGRGQSACTPCNAGKFQNLEGQGSCTANCAVGQYSLAGQDSCTACPAGRYGDAEGQSTASCSGECPSGQYSIGDSATCTSCTAGLYGSSTGLESADCSGPCDAGYYGATAGQQTAACTAPCSAGQYSEGRATACSDCDAGYYSTSSGATTSSCEAPCPQGYFSYAGAVNCTACAAGRFARTGSSTDACDGECELGLRSGAGSAECESCANGRYPNEARTICSGICAAGRYSVGGMAACGNCPAGYYVGERERGMCNPCTAGRFSAAENKTTSCTDTCPRGKYAPTGSSKCKGCKDFFFSDNDGAESCKACQKGTEGCADGKIRIGCTTDPQTIDDTECFGGCAQGYFSVNATPTPHFICDECKDSLQYAREGSMCCNEAACNTSMAENSWPKAFMQGCRSCKFIAKPLCNACDRGFFAPIPDMTECTTCPRGYYSPELQSQACISCVAGTYQSNNASSTCEECPLGKYQPKLVQWNCTDCPATMYQDEVGQTFCKRCEAGKYGTEVAADNCIACLAGRYSSAQERDCTACITGRYQAQASQGSCDDCPAGYYRDTSSTFPATADSASGRACTRCASGKNSAAAALACSDCGAGLYRDSTQMVCTGCDPGLYSTGAASICTGCDPGLYSSSSAARDCNTCPMGKFQGDASAHQCKNCAPGQYQDQISQPTCVQCTVGMSTPFNMSLFCSPCAAGKYEDAVGQPTCKNCFQGNYSTTGVTNCEACEQGQVSMSGQATCTKCSSGRYNGGGVEGAVECKACLGGRFSLEGTAECSLCSAGMYGNSSAPNDSADHCVLCEEGRYTEREGATGYSSSAGCIACAAGQFGLEGASSSRCSGKCVRGSWSTEGSDACAACPLGTHGNSEGGQNVTAACILCEAGKVQSNEGSTYCEACDGGSYQNSTGSYECKPCEQGRFSGIASDSCEACEKGKYAEVNAPACTECEAGFHNSVRGHYVCEECLDGSYSLDGAADCTTCAAGQYGEIGGVKNASEYCKACGPGMYQSALGKLECINCLAGQYGSEGSSSDACSGRCSAGSWSLAGHRACTECGPGRYGGSDNRQDSEDEQCQNCEPGKFQDNDGMTYCEACYGGFFQPTNGSTTCEPCGMGTYSGPGAEICDRCGNGTISTGSTSSCSACPEGLFADISVCAPCPLGSACTEGVREVCAPGYYSDMTHATVCDACPGGRYGGSSGYSSSECTGNCSAGFHCLPGSRSPMQKACATGTYCPNGTETPKPLTVGVYLDEWEDAHSCPAGHKCVSGIKVPCPGGWFQDEDEQFMCKICPRGYVQSMTGKTLCKECSWGKFSEGAADECKHWWVYLFAVFALYSPPSCSLPPPNTTTHQPRRLLPR
jgi:hypothetical protein